MHTDAAVFIQGHLLLFYFFLAVKDLDYVHYRILENLRNDMYSYYISPYLDLILRSQNQDTFDLGLNSVDLTKYKHSL